MNKDCLPECDETCAVCGAQTVNYCVCPECPHCHTVGNPLCYENAGSELFVDNPSLQHCGLIMTHAQTQSIQQAEKHWSEIKANEDAYAELITQEIQNEFSNI